LVSPQKAKRKKSKTPPLKRHIEKDTPSYLKEGVAKLQGAETVTFHLYSAPCSAAERKGYHHEKPISGQGFYRNFALSDPTRTTGKRILVYT
jgi:hypothetical protein